MSNLMLFNKPFNVLCQFTDQCGRKTLKNYIDLPKFYPAGRLDKDSEGLLLLTDDGKLQSRISDPKHKWKKVYIVQVEQNITDEAIKKIQQGLYLKDGLTLPAKCCKIKPPEWLWQRNPPIRERKNIPTSWIKITLMEGKNRQIRRMTAHVGFPTLRLIRTQIGDFKYDNLQSGKWRLIQV